MSKIETGGTAFPTEGEQQIKGKLWRFEGMSLRDFFAANCPITISEADNYMDKNGNLYEFYAKMRYQYADAMIAERAK